MQIHRILRFLSTATASFMLAATANLLPAHASGVSARTHCTTQLYIKETADSSTTSSYLPLTEATETNSNTDQLPLKTDGNTDTLPVSYDLREEGFETSVKNQGLDGMCWAFATLGAAETYLMKHDLLQESDTITGEPDLSEEQVGYYLYTPDPQPLSPVYNDAIIQKHKGASGGNALHASFFLSTIGIQNETYLPYNGYIREHSEYQRYPANFRMTDSEIIMSVHTDTDRNRIKENMMENGGVYAAFYSNTLKYYDNGTSYAYYQTDQSYNGANHAVLLVGWDDNYSKENFIPNKQPSIDGAWLVKNSWGDGRLDDGYFWISYAEPSLGEFSTFTFEPREDSGNIYYYDGAGYSTAYAFSSAANVFLAETDDTLSKVGFYQCSRNDSAKYTIQIYRLSETSSDPTDGELLQETIGICDCFGYHEIPLTEPVFVSKGERFSVVLSLKIGVGYRQTGYLTIEEAFQSNYTMQFSAKPGQSYILEDNTWKDTTTLYGEFGDFYNVNLHVITDPSEQKPDTTQLEQILSYDLTNVSAAEQAKALLEESESDTISQSQLDCLAALLLSELEENDLLQYPDHAYSNQHLFYGDINEDGAVNVEDAILCLTVYAHNSALLPNMLRFRQKLEADVDGRLDGITVEDAIAILNYYARQSAALPATWEQRK